MMAMPAKRFTCRPGVQSASRAVRSTLDISGSALWLTKLLHVQTLENLV